eukprot:3259241-Pleurochrysis_carterae.AAC.1
MCMYRVHVAVPRDVAHMEHATQRESRTQPGAHGAAHGATARTLASSHLRRLKRAAPTRECARAQSGRRRSASCPSESASACRCWCDRHAARFE